MVVFLIFVRKRRLAVRTQLRMKSCHFIDIITAFYDTCGDPKRIFSTSVYDQAESIGVVRNNEMLSNRTNCKKQGNFKKLLREP